MLVSGKRVGEWWFHTVSATEAIFSNTITYWVLVELHLHVYVRKDFRLLLL